MAQKQYSINPVQTSFPMKANSQVREVEIQAWWESIKVYARNLEKRKNGEKFVLHDGPPYLSSAKIHIGTALNKILKDIVTRYKAKTGKYAPYVPGYDSHGLPIETAVLKDVKGGRQTMSVLELRKRCREFALTNLKGQESNFKRLGVWGDWENPYVTLDQKFEAAQLRVFGKMASEGYLYKGLKSITWCANCETALAEAEIEYSDITSDDIYVKFAVEPESITKLAKLLNKKFNPDQKVSFVIWTTTTWTIPANVAIAVNADFDYEFLKLKSGELLVIASLLKDSFLEKTDLANDYVGSAGTILGKELEFLKTKHPFFDRESIIILSDHVTADAGTGNVHTAPGHGPEDFELGMRYKLPIITACR
jgi:isoleucyl-tRNA synthetase